MNKHLGILLALVACVCLVNATADRQPKPAQAPKNSTDKVVPTGDGGDLNGGASGAAMPAESLGTSSGGVASVASSGAVGDAAVGSGGVSTMGSVGGGITVIGSGTRPLSSDAGSGKPDEGARTRSDRGRQQGLGESLGRGEGGGVTLAGPNGVGLGGGLRGYPAGGAQPRGGVGFAGGASQAGPRGPSNGGDREKPEQGARTGSDRGRQQGLGGSLGGGSAGGVTVTGDNGVGLGGGLPGYPAEGAQPRGGVGFAGGASPAGTGRPLNGRDIGNANSGPPGIGAASGGPEVTNPSSGLGSSRVGGGPGGNVSRAGSPGGRLGNLSTGGAVYGSSSNLNGDSNGVSGSGFFGDDSSSTSFGFGESFPDGLGGSSSFGNSDMASGGPGVPTSGSSGSGFGSAASGSASFNGRAGGEAGRTAGRRGGRERNPLSERLPFTRGSSASGASNGNPGNSLSQGGSSLGSSRLGDGFAHGRGTSRVAGPRGHTSGPAGSVFRSSVSGSPNGRLGEGVGGAGGLRERIRSGRREYTRGASASSGSNRIRGRGFSRSTSTGSSGSGDNFADGFGTRNSAANFATATGGPVRGSSASSGGLRSRTGEVGGRGGGNTFGAGGVSGAPVPGGRGRFNHRMGTNRGSDRTPPLSLPTSGPSTGSPGTGDGDSVSLDAGSSGSNLNGGAVGAQRGTGSRNSGDSDFGSSGAGSGTSAGTAGGISRGGRGSNGGPGALEPSSPTSGNGDFSESETGHDGSSNAPAGENSTDAGSPNTDNNSDLSIPLGDGPLGLDLPKWFPRRSDVRRHDPAVAAAVALGALAGVAAVGALGAGIAAAVHASRRRNMPLGAGRRGAPGRRRWKPAHKPRGDRQRRSIPESKVPAEVLDQIPMNFERLY